MVFYMSCVATPPGGAAPTAHCDSAAGASLRHSYKILAVYQGGPASLAFAGDVPTAFAKQIIFRHQQKFRTVAAARHEGNNNKTKYRHVIDTVML
jgi:hypothetical protein